MNPFTAQIIETGELVYMHTTVSFQRIQGCSMEYWNSVTKSIRTIKFTLADYHHPEQLISIYAINRIEI